MLNVLGLVIIWAENEENTFQVEEKEREPVIEVKESVLLMQSIAEIQKPAGFDNKVIFYVT